MAGPTPGEVRDLWAHTSSVHGSRVVPKTDSGFMRVVGGVLDTLGVVDREPFLTSYSTTIGRRIFVPFTIGEGDARERWGQVIACAHEHQHVVQAREIGMAEFAVEYLTDRALRTRFEAAAYMTTMELERWRWGRVLTTPVALAGKLRAYAVKGGDLRVAEQIYAGAMAPIEAGHLINEATRTVVDWLEEHAPHVKEM